MRIVNSLHADRPIIIDTVPEAPIIIFSACFYRFKLFFHNKISKFMFEFIILDYCCSLKRVFNSFLQERDEKKKSPGIDALVVDQATLCHMIFPALPTVCEDAIHSERIGSPVLHHKSRDAPINTQDVQTFIIAPFRCALPVTSRLRALLVTF